VYNCNPLATLPEQAKVRRGLEREDLFTVVYEQVMTDTARYADVVLPATTFLEHRELRRAYGAYVLYESAPVVDPVGESRPNHEVFSEICDRIGLGRDDDPRGDRRIIDSMLAPTYGANGVGARLAAGDLVTPEFGDRPIQFVDVFPLTDDTKIHLLPEELDEEAADRGGLYHFAALPGTDEFPLALISPAHKLQISSTFGQLNADIVPVQLHPDDARQRAIENGDEVRVFNERGAVICTASINDALRPGVACIPKGTWDHNTRSGNTANVLVPDDLTDIAGGACFNDARVEVVRNA
jgi:anaerobic selenocysteine-containing dehydrogenase